MRCLSVLLAASLGGFAADVDIAVFGLFRPSELRLTALEQTLSTGGESVLPGRSLTIRGSVSVSCGPMELAVPDRITRRYEGCLTVERDGAVLRPVIRMDLERAVASSVAAEMPRDAPMEALKAIAVLARSIYAAGSPAHAHGHFCDTTHCQFVRGVVPQTHAAVRAAASTQGLVLRRKGVVWPAMYSADCGGKTRTPVQIGLRDKSGYQGVSCVRGPVVSNGGHGVGVCQHGAMKMAEAGEDFRSILRHYLPAGNISE